MREGATPRKTIYSSTPQSQETASTDNMELPWQLGLSAWTEKVTIACIVCQRSPLINRGVFSDLIEDVPIFLNDMIFILGLRTIVQQRDKYKGIA